MAHWGGGVFCVKKNYISVPRKHRNVYSYLILAGTAVAQWLRCCTTNRKVAGSIPDGVTGIFH